MTRGINQKNTNKRNITTPIAVEGFLKGIHYPTDKSNLVDRAKQNKAPENIMNILNRLEKNEYKSPIDVSKEVSKVR